MEHVTEAAPPGRVDGRGWPWWDEEVSLWAPCVGKPFEMTSQLLKVPRQLSPPSRGPCRMAGFFVLPCPPAVSKSARIKLQPVQASVAHVKSVINRLSLSR